MTKKVLVLSGGFSSEREVSLVSGKEIAGALRRSGYTVVEHDLISTEAFIDVLRAEKPDVVFNALHGNWGEDGAVQAFLDLMQIPYTYSGMEASHIGMNKMLTKEICAQNNIKTPKGALMTFARYKEIKADLRFPYVVKPCNDGSSVGVFIVKTPQDAQSVYYDDEQRKILVEEFIDGHELTVAVIGNKACAVTELKAKAEFYNYNSKYTNGMTMHELPAKIPEEAAKTAMVYAEKLHNLLGCNMVSRSDLRYNEKDGVVLLEINTNPGMTPLSLVPEQAKYIGMTYEELCSLLVENAQCRKLQCPLSAQEKAAC